MSERVESHGTPHMAARPVDFPCQGPGCGGHVVTYLTDEDIEARETVRVYRPTADADDERLVRYLFCSSDCRATFINAVESGERPETLYEGSD
ncbi:hypothetical protein [Halococcus thailandensis]|uniref:Uncharacterized protein n=1 Tax=Halococcus thailandensis JCM 13552 TaxID=1227457 RepID=M0NEV7_9EURY|nr:hypothetical protein [Halococcus thailandensis]EMA56386.1 hypothetical protein C451_02612 [Halococcus thailandensis JCM 13552]